MTAQPLPVAVQTEVINAIRAAFYYRDDFKALMLTAGVPRGMYGRHDHPENSKTVMARRILDELHDLGPTGWTIQRKIAVELCAMDRPGNGVEDAKNARDSLHRLRQVATSARIIIDTEQAAIDERRAREAKRQQTLAEERRNIEHLSRRFAELATDRPRTASEKQARGYQLETLLVDLFAANHLDYVGSRRQPHEQVDGSFFFRGFTYLVEARWRSDKPTIGDLADFKFKVDGKLESTRGLFISMAGFDSEILGYFAHNSGTRNNIIYMTGHDLALIFGGQVGLEDALLKKIDAAESRGEYLVDLKT
ncbi:hypothetical protein [Rhodococcus wratislaviensis]|uniref:Restriction endonuclease type IV Mrr domain-containing protein n=1 Tax=Rhodococcus wratislaviensis NBRC 100605 TaxID=1219028 RepID=X0PRK3_RHOWR|nr:hypothetical protein [Rhodococcus wratislaviensis]GAF45498.1 hypothetical protein RW1_022_00760 [Rhodococcus wratislaviensis NBRC 100605]